MGWKDLVGDIVEEGVKILTGDEELADDAEDLVEAILGDDEEDDD